MNFTYLVEGPTEPDQADLEKYRHFVVVVVLDQEMQDFVVQEAGYEMRSSSKAMCWLLRPEHLKTAPPGSVLARLGKLLETHRLYSDIEHSFLATASREEIMSMEISTAGYAPLHLRTWEKQEDRIDTLRKAVLAALNSAERPEPGSALSKISEAVSAVELVKFVMEIFTS